MEKYCPSCGAEIDEQAPKCPKCGTIQESFVYKSRVAAAALAIFAGIFGGHRFYLGQWWGIFYLLFCWTYIPWLVSLIEGIVFLATSQHKWNEKYNQGISAGSEKGTVVVVLACIFPAIAVIGILAAIAIPAYHDYTVRAKLAESHMLAEQVMSAVETYAYDNRQWPLSIDDLGISAYPDSEYVSSVEVDEGVVTINPVPSLGVSGSIIYVPSVEGEEIAWSCQESTLAPAYLPSECK